MAAKKTAKPVLVVQTKGKSFYANVVRLAGGKHTLTVADGAGKRVRQDMSRGDALDAYHAFVDKRLRPGK